MITGAKSPATVVVPIGCKRKSRTRTVQEIPTTADEEMLGATTRKPGDPSQRHLHFSTCRHSHLTSSGEYWCRIGSTVTAKHIDVTTDRTRNELIFRAEEAA
jgi:hypothetical protein